MPVMAVGGPSRPFDLKFYGRTVLLSVEYPVLTQTNSVLIRQMIIPSECMTNSFSHGIHCWFERAALLGDAIS